MLEERPEGRDCGGNEKEGFLGEGKERKSDIQRGEKKERGGRGRQEEPQAVSKVFQGRTLAFEVPLISTSTNPKPKQKEINKYTFF